MRSCIHVGGGHTLLICCLSTSAMQKRKRVQSSAACNDARKHKKVRLLRLLASGTETPRLSNRAQGNRSIGRLRSSVPVQRKRARACTVRKTCIKFRHASRAFAKGKDSKSKCSTKLLPSSMRLFCPVTLGQTICAREY